MNEKQNENMESVGQVTESVTLLHDSPPVVVDEFVEQINIEKCINDTNRIVSELYEKYENDPYMLSKTQHLLQIQVPNMLLNMMKIRDDRQQRFEELSIEQDGFIHSFLNNNRYFYISSTDRFFYYDGLHYLNISEDEILCRILTLISRGRQLMSWKQKTKLNIMKRIKEHILLKSIPESNTIQYVLDLLYPSIFGSKEEAKYFLTILGDNILRKNMNLVHFISTSSKHFIRYLNELSYTNLGINIYNTFKHKYHEHEYSNCRLIMINANGMQESVWKPILTKYSIDILCVSAHYSVRYGSSDDYITNSCNDSRLIHNVFYLRGRTHEDLVKQFITSYLRMSRSRGGSFDPFAPATSRLGGGESFALSETIENNVSTSTSTSAQISWKNMQYLWKHYLDSQNLPTVMFQQTLKGYLIDHLRDNYVSEEDCFKGVFSKYLLVIQKFMQFWEENIVDIIGYYYPTVEIEQDKFIHHIRCVIWDKQMDIQIALEHHKEILRESFTSVTDSMSADIDALQDIHLPSNEGSNEGSTPHITISSVTFYDMYLQYCKYYSGIDGCLINPATDGTEIFRRRESTPSTKVYGVPSLTGAFGYGSLQKSMIVSKSYFDKYILETMSEFVIDSTMVSSNWYMV